MSTKLCGMYCLHTVMKLYGINKDIKDLVIPKYVGSKEGSSFAELQRAAEDNGMYARPVTRLSCQQLQGLKRLPGPLILHVKRKPGGLYDHYVLFLGVAEGKARIFNPPDPVTLVDFATLSTVWDGTAVIVSDRPIHPWTFLLPVWLYYAGVCCVCLMVIVALRFVQRRLFHERSTWSCQERFQIYTIQSAFVVLVALTLAGASHLCRSDGFLAHQEGVAAVQRAALNTFIPKISLRQFERRLGEQGVVLVDARFPVDYNAGHFDGAISIPVDANEAYIAGTMEPISRTRPLIVYCQSSTCPFATLIAEELVVKGFSRVSILKEGWSGWTRANKSPSDRT